METFEGYCVKCREKRKCDVVGKIKTKNNRNALQGKCSVCGTKVVRFI